jgi:hypothetical protein
VTFAVTVVVVATTHALVLTVSHDLPVCKPFIAAALPALLHRTLFTPSRQSPSKAEYLHDIFTALRLMRATRRLPRPRLFQQDAKMRRISPRCQVPYRETAAHTRGYAAALPISSSCIPATIIDRAGPRTVEASRPEWA